MQVHHLQRNPPLLSNTYLRVNLRARRMACFAWLLLNERAGFSGAPTCCSLGVVLSLDKGEGDATAGLGAGIGMEKRRGLGGVAGFTPSTLFAATGGGLGNGFEEKDSKASIFPGEASGLAATDLGSSLAAEAGLSLYQLICSSRSTSTSSLRRWNSAMHSCSVGKEIQSFLLPA